MIIQEFQSELTIFGVPRNHVTFNAKRPTLVIRAQVLKGQITLSNGLIAIQLISVKKKRTAHPPDRNLSNR